MRATVEFSMLPFDNDGAILGIGVVLRGVTKRFEEMKRLGERLE